MKQPVSRDRLNLLSRCMIFKRHWNLSFPCIVHIHIWISPPSTYVVTWSVASQGKMLNNAFGKQIYYTDQTPVSCLLESYWTVKNSCSQRGPAFGLLLPFHISSSFWNSTCLCLTVLNFSKFNKPTDPHFLRRISNRYRSTPSIL